MIIAPKSLLRSAWEDDFKKFAPQVTVSVAPADKREQAFNTPADVYVTNTDAVNWLAKQDAKFFKRFDTLIVDELSAFKFARQKSKLAGTIRGSYFVIKGDY